MLPDGSIAQCAQYACKHLLRGTCWYSFEFLVKLLICLRACLIPKFLRSITSAGAIECVEGGGHYRPIKHAELARDISHSGSKAHEAVGSEQTLRFCCSS